MPISQLKGIGISHETTIHITIPIIRMIIPLFTNPKYIWPSPESITARIIVKPRFFTNICTTIKLLNRLSKKLGKDKTDKALSN